MLLRPTDLRQKGTVARKLLPKWIGPFKVLKKVGGLAYELELPSYLPVHNVLLKGWRSDERSQPPPDPIPVDGYLEYEVEEIIEERTVKSGRRTRKEYLVRWKGYGKEHDTWEAAENVEETSALEIYLAHHGTA